MPIRVICPGCRKSFNVDDKHAGKTGNCPACKHPIKIPSVKEEVKVHGGEDFSGGGKTASGQLALKPVSRKEMKVGPVAIIGVVAGCLLVAALTVVLRTQLQSSFLLRGLGLLLITPPLVLAAYGFLRDDELEPFRGKELYLRMGICSLVYAILWLALPYMGDVMAVGEEPYMWVLVVAPLAIGGGIAAFASLDLAPGSAALHLAFYTLITFLLRVAAGIPWPWQQGG